MLLVVDDEDKDVDDLSTVNLDDDESPKLLLIKDEAYDFLFSLSFCCVCVVPPLICWAEEEEEEEEEDAGPASNIEQRGRRCGCRQNGGRTHTANKTDTQQREREQLAN